MAGQTESLEVMPAKTPDASSPTQAPTLSGSPGDFGLAAIQWAAGNMAIQRTARGDSGDEATGRADASVWARYPALTRILPKEVLENRASASVSVPLSLLLRPDASFADRDIWDAFLANRRSHGSEAAAAELLRNEMMREYFAGKLSLLDRVRIEVTPPLSPGAPANLMFRLHGQELFTPDGMISASDLFIFGPIEPVVEKVQREASYVELAGKLLDEVEELEGVVNGVLVNVRLEPKDFAMNDIFRIEQRVHVAKRALDDWECTAGPVLPAAANLVSRYDNVLSVAKDTSNFAKWWHKENTMESAGQANKRRGSATGDWYDVPVAGFWSLVESVEVVGTLGAHNTRTQIAEAYTAGDISWNEAKGLVNKSTRRALITAAFVGALGPVAGRFGTGFATELGLGRVGVGAVGSGIGGGITSAGMLASQTILTRFGGGSLSPVGQSIWNSGAPSRASWAIGVPLGVVMGGLYGARASTPPVSRTDAPTAGTPLPAGDRPAASQFDPVEPPAASSTPSQFSRPSPLFARPWVPPGLFGRAVLWGRLRFGEPIMQAASEPNIELMGEPSAIPGGSSAGTSASSPAAAAPSTPTPDTPVRDLSAFDEPGPPALPSATQSTESPVPAAAPEISTVQQIVSLGYRPGPGERSVTRSQWKQFSSQVRQNNEMNRSMSEASQFQVSNLEDVSPMRRPNSDEPVPPYADVGLNVAQEAAAGRLFGRLWDAGFRQAWRDCDNALARQRMGEVRRLWNLGTQISRQQARDLARSTFDNWVGRFWRRLRADPTLNTMFTDAGLTFPAGRAPYYEWADGFDEGVTIEHWGSRLTDDPTRAVDDANMMFSMRRENVNVLEKLRRQGW